MSRALALRCSPRRAGLLLVGVALGALAVFGPAAVAASPATAVTATGWWWRAQTGIGPALPPPPNVGEGDLMVGATPEGATAIAAIALTLGDGRINPRLTLTVVPDGDQGGEGAALLACHSGSAWDAAQAGVWDAAPKVDCSTSVSGIRADNGRSWTFPLGPLQFENRLDIVIVPAAGADGSIAAFNLIFDGPSASHIETVAGAEPAAVPPTDPPATARPAVVPGVAQPPVTAAAVLAPTAPGAPAVEPDRQGNTATAPRVVSSAAPPIPVVSRSRTAARVAGVVAMLIGLTGGYLALAGRLPSGGTATGGAPVAGGIGRFRRERTSEPAAIS